MSVCTQILQPLPQSFLIHQSLAESERRLRFQQCEVWERLQWVNVRLQSGDNPCSHKQMLDRHKPHSKHTHSVKHLWSATTLSVHTRMTSRARTHTVCNCRFIGKRMENCFKHHFYFILLQLWYKWSFIGLSHSSSLYLLKNHPDENRVFSMFLWPFSHASRKSL